MPTYKQANKPAYKPAYKQTNKHACIHACVLMFSSPLPIQPIALLCSALLCVLNTYKKPKQISPIPLQTGVKKGVYNKITKNTPPNRA